MKAKIFVSCNSGLNFINHEDDIVVINDRIALNDYDVYYLNKDINLINLYQRLRVVKRNVKVLPPEYDYLVNEINNNLGDYDVYVYLVNKNDNEYINMVKKIRDDLNINFDIIPVNKISYPLLIDSKEALKMYKQDVSLKTIKDYLNLDFKYKILFYSPENDKYNNIVINYENDLTDDKSKIYEYSKSSISQVKVNKKDNHISYILKNILHEIENKDFKLFLMYTYENSTYLKYLIDKIKEHYPNLDDVDIIPMPIEFSSKVGYNSIGIGYVINNR